MAKKSAGTILKTKAECARHFGVSTKTVGEWLTESSFPGRSGTRGKRCGHFPVDDIAKWRKGRAHRNSIGDPELNSQIQRQKLRKIRMENDAAAGLMIELDTVERIVSRSIAMTKQVLYQLVFELPAALPSATPAAIKEEVSAMVRQKLDTACGYLAAELRTIKGTVS